MSVSYDDIHILKDYTDLNESIMEQLTLAQTVEEAQEYLNMIEGLAIHEKAPSVAKSMYGLAYLMEGKPWYDYERGFDAVKEAADGNDPFCWFILGSLYLNGKPSLQRDLISAKYWLGRAANAGLKEAISVYELEWGDNPEGFRDYVKSGEMESDIWRRYSFKMILVGLGFIGAIALLLYGLGFFG